MITLNVYLSLPIIENSGKVAQNQVKEDRETDAFCFIKGGRFYFNFLSKVCTCQNNGVTLHKTKKLVYTAKW